MSDLDGWTAQDDPPDPVEEEDSSDHTGSDDTTKVQNPMVALGTLQSDLKSYDSEVSEHMAMVREGKMYRLHGKSLGIFETDAPIRVFAADVTHHQACEAFILSCICVNILFLMIQNPSNKHNIEDIEPTLDIIDLIITCIFTLEMIMRVVALGFVVGHGTYLRDAWNVLDFVLVLSAWLSMILFSGADAPVKPTIFRCLRVLRPLRSMKFFGGLKAIIDFLPFLGHVVSFLVFFFIVFGVVGMQLFGGALTLKCMDNMSEQEYAAFSQPTRKCPHQLSCKRDLCEVVTSATYNYSLVYADERVAEIDFYGFDNMFKAFLTQFIVATMDEWPALSHPLLAADTNYKSLVWWYFALMLIVLALVVSNLFVSVVVYAFGNAHTEEDPAVAVATVKKLRALFNRMDVGATGSISGKDVARLANTLRIKLSDSQLNDAMCEMDVKREGLVDFVEFVEWWKLDTDFGMRLRRAIGMEESLIHGVFDQVDEDNSGELSSEEVLALSTKLGITLSTEELQQAMKEMDEDLDDSVTFDEFSAWWLSDSPVAKKLGAAAQSEERKVKLLFALVDKDKSGELDVEEVMALGQSFGCSISRSEANEIYAEFKLPESQKTATIEDFATWWKSDAKHAVRLRHEAQAMEMRMRTIFERVDVDHSGAIQEEEIIDICKLGGHDLTSEEAEEIIQEIDGSGNAYVEFLEFYQWIFSGTEWSKTLRKAIDQVVLSQNAPGFPYIPGLSPCCRSMVVESNGFEHTMFAIVTLNTVLMACEHDSMSDALINFIFNAEFAFTFLYVIEAFIKIVGLSAKSYFQSYLNCLDFFIVIASIVGHLMPQHASGFTAFRVVRLVVKLMRVLRMVKLLSKYDAVVSLLKTVIGSSGMIGTLSCFIIFVLVLLSIFASHTLGTCHLDNPQHQAFVWVNGTRRINPDANAFPRSNFFSITDAILTNFQIMTGEDWSVIMYFYMHCYSRNAWIYFVFVFSLTNFILLNMFVAVVLENFEFSHEEKLIKQERQYMQSVQDKDPQSGAGTLGMAEDIRDQTSAGRKEARELKKKIKMNRFFRDHSTRAAEEEDEEDGSNWNKTRADEEDGDEIANESVDGDVALLSLDLDNCFRKGCYDVAESNWFDNMVLAVITVASILLAAEGPRDAEYLKDEPTLKAVMQVLDYLCVLFFFVEMMIKIIAYGFIATPRAYIKDPWNQLDFTVVMVSFVELILAWTGSAAAVSVRVLRLLRVLRPLRMIRRNENMRVVVDSILRCMPTISAVVALGMMFYLTFGILGVGLFMGKFRRCYGDETLDKINCEARYGANSWRNPPYNFDNIFAAIRTLFICSTAEGWVEIMQTGMDVTEKGLAPRRDNEYGYFLYFWAFMIFGSFFLTNIFIGVLVSFFGESSGTALLTHKQREWLQTQILILRTTTRAHRGPEKGSWRRPLYLFASHHIFDRCITVLVILNVVVLMFETTPAEDALIPYETLDACNTVFLIIFTVELVFKSVAFGPMGYISDKWSQLDAFVIIVGWFGWALSDSAAVQALRSLRILRIAMLLKSSDVLRSLFGTLLMSLPPAMNLTLLWLLVFFIYGVIGMQYFWNFTNESGELGFINDNDNFRDILHSMRFLFQVSTGQDFMHLTHQIESHSSGSFGLTFLYFFSFIVISIWMFSNLFVAVLLENFEINFTTENLELKDDDIQRFKDEWLKFSEGPDNDVIKVKDIQELVPLTPAPLSVVATEDPFWFNRLLFELELDFENPDAKVMEQTVGFHELLQRKRQIMQEKEQIFAEKIIACCARAFLARRCGSADRVSIAC